jgi:hypothetical protein
MCSGCSAYFEDGEDREQMGSDRIEEASWGFGSEIAQSGEARDECDSTGSVQENMDAEDCEILVSAQQIVERRTIRTNCAVKGAFEVAEALERTLPMKYCSKARSARDYRTQASRGNDVGIYLMWLWLASVMVGLLAIWMAAG